MKRLALSSMLGFALVATAAAQAGSAGSTTSGGSSYPSGSSSSGTQDQSSTPSTSGSSSGKMSTSSNAHEKKAKMTGCISSQGGSYYLVDKKHPSGVQLLSSEDLSAHVGHKVEVKGNWESASASSASSSGPSSSTPSTSASSSNPSSSASASGSTSDASNPTSAGSGSASSLPQSDVGAGKAIRVSEIKMKSDTCEGGNKSNNPSTPK